jgi:heat shock protein HslJ
MALRLSACLTLVLVACLGFAGCGGSDGDEQAPAGDDLHGRTFVSTKDWSGDGSSFSTPVTVAFKTDGGMTWQADCNTAGADVEIAADRLILGQIASTAIGCPGQPQEQDEELAAFFESDPGWRLDGDRLTLSSDSVEVVLRATSGH